MVSRLLDLRWKFFETRYKKMLVNGLRNEKIELYDDDLIIKLRSIYYGGVPASIILLCNALSNGFCYDRALLMAQAFLDDDIKLVYATVDSLRLNPKYISNDKMYADHCFLERTTKDGRELVYDTTSGFCFDKKYYYEIEHPKIRKINDKESIIRFLEEDKELHPEDLESSMIFLPYILSKVESILNSPYEMYANKTLNLLQREIEVLRNSIDFEEFNRKIKEDMVMKGFM